MFRMGGRSDDGIMSVRPGYAEGDSVRDNIEKEINNLLNKNSTEDIVADVHYRTIDLFGKIGKKKSVSEDTA